MKDEIVLVASVSSRLAKLNSIFATDLMDIPLVLSLAGSGNLDVVQKTLTNIGVDIDMLTTKSQLESTIVIEEYLNHEDTATFLSLLSVRNELQDKQLTIIEVDGLSSLRDFKFI